MTITVLYCYSAHVPILVSDDNLLSVLAAFIGPTEAGGPMRSATCWTGTNGRTIEGSVSLFLHLIEPQTGLIVMDDENTIPGANHSSSNNNNIISFLLPNKIRICHRYFPFFDWCEGCNSSGSSSIIVVVMVIQMTML
jgi:hypothetical protein